VEGKGGNLWQWGEKRAGLGQVCRGGGVDYMTAFLSRKSELCNP